MPKRFLIALVSLAGLTLPAHADRIDGDWCGEGGKHFRIEGPKIETPGGTVAEGEYSRHSFRYTVPAGEADAGQAIEMLLQSEELLFLKRTTGGEAGAVERWRRCEVVS